MWIARDEDGSLWLFNRKPLRKNSTNWLSQELGETEELLLEGDWFPEVQWSDEEPRELVLKPIKEE